MTSLSFVGMFIGSLVAGWIADRWGRKNALTITTVWFAVFSLAADAVLNEIEATIAAERGPLPTPAAGEGRAADGLGPVNGAGWAVHGVRRPPLRDHPPGPPVGSAE